VANVLFANYNALVNFVTTKRSTEMKNINNLLSWRILGLILCVQLFASARLANDALNTNTTEHKKGLVYIFEIRQEIGKPVWRITQKAFEEAIALKADYILIHINTYGGRVDIADSIRTKILNSLIPVLVFIDNQAISAGALISIAADSIYMRSGGSIGAATVVNQTGQAVPDKYQSFMRSTMRATAEAHGKDTLISGNDTIYRWRRDPHIAEAMVDPQRGLKDLVDSGKVLTLTVDEAIKVGYCEGKASGIDEVLKMAGIGEFEMKQYKLSGVDQIIVFLLNPIVQTILILLIIGGIYFELQAPGIGLPLAISIAGALLYFAPLYIEGLAENWEVLIFIAGLILLGLEIFVIPGFGITGISGILLMLVGLTMGLIDNVVFELEGLNAFSKVAKVFIRIFITVFASFLFSLWISRKVGTTNLFKNISLDASQDKSEGFIGIDTRQKKMIGKIGIAHTVLRPSGKVKIEGELFDAVSEIGFIDKGIEVKVTHDETGQLYVIKLVK
jgi:membrane-bound serine protease (ClpP class)